MRNGPCVSGAVCSRGDDLTFRCAERETDGFDLELIAVDVDECDHLVVGWLGFVGKEIEAVRRIWLVRCSWRFSLHSLRFPWLQWG